MNINRCILFIAIILVVSDVNANQLDMPKKMPDIGILLDMCPFDRAVCCIKYFEGMHNKNDYPYVGYGHRLTPGERFYTDMSESQAEIILRNDLLKLCKLFREYGKDSLILAVLAYNVGQSKIIGNMKYPKSRLLQKIEEGRRDIESDYISFCQWKGRTIPAIVRRRQIELILLYSP